MRQRGPNLQQLPKGTPMNPELRLEIERRRALMVGIDLGKLEAHMLAVAHGNLMGWTAGLYRLSGTNGAYMLRTASGNARQRRLQVRRWRRAGFTVVPHTTHP